MDDKDDGIFELPAFDQASNYSFIVSTFVLKVDGQLDSEAFQDGFRKLMEMGNWNRVGARLVRIGKDNRLGIRLLREYTEDRPPARFSTKHYDVPVNAHPLGSKTSAMTDENPIWLAAPSECEKLIRSEDAPTSLSDYVGKSESMLSFHFSIFEDASIIGITAPHACWDAQAVVATVNAVLCICDGRSNEVPECYSVTEFPIEEFASQANPSDVSELQRQRLSLLQTLMLLFYLIWELLTKRREEGRVIRLPAAFLNNMVAEAKEEAKFKREYISENDVLCAWYLKNYLNGSVWNPRKSVAFGINFGLRLKQVYLGNNLVFPSSALEIGFIQNSSLGSIALQLRRMLTTKTGKEEQQQALAALGITLSQVSILTLLQFIMLPNVVTSLNCSSWMRSGISKLNFRSILIDRNPILIDRSPQQAECLPTYFGYARYQGSTPKRNTFFVLGKDAQGNVWVQTHLAVKDWAQFCENGSIKKARVSI